MRTFLEGLFDKLSEFNFKLDNTSKLMFQHWVDIHQIPQRKEVLIFRSGGELLIATNGKVKTAKWEYLNDGFLLIQNSGSTVLFKLLFQDNKLMALRKDGTNQIAFYINETVFMKELKNEKEAAEYLDSQVNQEREPQGSFHSNPFSKPNEGPKFFVLIHGAEKGPYSKDKLRSLVKNGHVSAMAFVRSEKEDDYSKRRRVKDII